MKKRTLLIICVLAMLISGVISYIVLLGPFSYAYKDTYKDIATDTATKPVIYLYPEKEIGVNVKLNYNGKLTCTYPKYDSSWNVIATPDSKIFFEGKEYNYLYWEGEADTNWDFSKGFCVKGEDTAEFLEWALKEQGLNRKEANEFIVYWLPRMEHNSYNIVSFQTATYTENAELQISPQPNTMIRIFMTWTQTDNYTEIQPQEFITPERNGFTMVEWGGCETNQKVE